MYFSINSNRFRYECGQQACNSVTSCGNKSEFDKLTAKNSLSLVSILSYIRFLSSSVAEHGSVSICDYGKNFTLNGKTHFECDFGEIPWDIHIGINVISDLFSQRLISSTTTTATKSNMPWFRMSNQMKTKSFRSKHTWRKTEIIGLCLCMRREKYTEICSMHKTLEYYVHTE